MRRKLGANFTTVQSDRFTLLTVNTSFQMRYSALEGKERASSENPSHRSSGHVSLFRLRMLGVVMIVEIVHHPFWDPCSKIAVLSLPYTGQLRTSINISDAVKDPVAIGYRIRVTHLHWSAIY
jgi:hypothetical protein